MGRIRTIKPEFWTSAQIVECSPIARLLFVGMWNFCDDCGTMPANPKTLKMLVFPGDDFMISQISEFVQELIQNELLVEYQADDGKSYWNVTGWRHQKIDRPQPAKYPKPSDSANVRRTFAEHSPTERKGKERKGEDITTTTTASENENENLEIQPTETWLSEIGTDFQIKEAFTLSRKIPKEKFEPFLAAFKIEARARSEPYRNRADIRSHFLNFSSRRNDAENKPARAAPTQTRSEPIPITPAQPGQLKHGW